MIILLKKQEVCPADVLILDTFKEIYSINDEANGKMHNYKKRALISTYGNKSNY